MHLGFERAASGPRAGRVRESFGSRADDGAGAASPIIPNHGLAIFSNHLGTRTFEATIGVTQPSISQPLGWLISPLIGLGEGCDAPFTLNATSYDLVADPNDPPPLDPAVQQLLSDTIVTTALPAALESVVIDRAVAIRYVEKFKAEPALLVLFELSAK